MSHGGGRVGVGGTYVAQLQLSDGPVLHHLLTLQGHLQVAMGAGLGVERPIMLALHLGEDAGSASRRPRAPAPRHLWVVALVFRA